MDAINQTLYIPLYGKAFVSRKGVILHDAKAEKIWAAESFPLKGRSKSKWLAYYMGMRSAVFDRWLREKASEAMDAAVIHIGCGLDSRNERVGIVGRDWYDIDFPDVIRERKKYYEETSLYRMIGADARDPAWIRRIPRARSAVIVMEGVSMYFDLPELRELLAALRERFGQVHILLDCYTVFAAKASRYRNPINDVGVTAAHGIDFPEALEEGTGISFVREHEMTPGYLIRELTGAEQLIFRKIYGGGISKKLYRLYEYSGS